VRNAIRLSSAIVVTASLAIPTAANAAPTCGAEITEDIVLTADLRGCPGDGLVAAAPGITIDAASHLIDGTGTGAGIRIAAADVTVRNARITDFQTGVAVPSTDFGAAALGNLKISRNGRGIQMGDGGFPSGAPGSLTITASKVFQNGDGITAFRWPYPALIADSTVIDNSGVGISVRDSGFATLSRNRIEGNGAGVTLWFAAGSLDRNQIADNLNHGVYVERGAGTTLVANSVTGNGTDGASFLEGAVTLERNTFNGNGRDGVRLEDSNVASRSRYSLSSNTANNNGEYGIRAVQTGFTNPLGGGNLARRNGARAQCLNFSCVR
jgi:parallel beta-helix repeat protein